MKRHRVSLRLNKADHERLEMIRAAYGGSLNGIIRMIIRATSQRLGIDTGKTTEDLLKNN